MERWYLDENGSRHAIEIRDTTWSRRVTWLVDDREVADKTTGDNAVVLTAETGAVRVKLPSMGIIARRVTWWGPDDDPEMQAHLGTGGIDFVPEPGTKSAKREARIRAHPRRYAVQRGATAAAGIIVPIVLVWLLTMVPWPSWNLPDLPRIPWPDLPSIPWPDWDLPDLLPDWEVPGWLLWLLDKAKYVVPVVIAIVLARAEVKRRTRQDAARGQGIEAGADDGRSVRSSRSEDSGEQPGDDA